MITIQAPRALRSAATFVSGGRTVPWLVAAAALSITAAGCVADEEATAEPTLLVDDEPIDRSALSLPSRVYVRVEPAVEGNLILDLFAEAGGGCNVQGPYTLEAESTSGDTDATVTILGHAYESDGQPCDQLATATNAVELPTSVTAGSQITVVLGDSSNEIEIVADGDELLARQPEIVNVELECPLAGSDPAVGCVITADG